MRRVYNEAGDLVGMKADYPQEADCAECAVVVKSDLSITILDNGWAVKTHNWPGFDMYGAGWVYKRSEKSLLLQHLATLLERMVPSNLGEVAE